MNFPYCSSHWFYEQSDSLGNIVDLRDKSTCPNLKNLSKWPSAKLQQTLIEAYEKQMEALKEHEGDDTKLYLSLRNELKRVSVGFIYMQGS